VTSDSGRATLATVAASAGVSVATVSKVLNGRTDVAPATRALIQTLLRQHDYTARRAPATRRGSTPPPIELMFGGHLNAYSTAIIQGVVDAGAAAGVTVAVSLRDQDPKAAAAHRRGSWSRDLAAAGRTAVIAVVKDVTSEDLHVLSRARLPLVVVDPLHLPRALVTSVGSTNFAGGLAATEHLLSLGHRRIGYLGGPAAAACNQARLQGYRAAMDAAGATVPEAYVRTGQFGYSDGVSGGAVLLDLPEPPTAVFAGSDETAAGVIEAARTRGLRIPADISIVGFDDTQVAWFASPPLTTVRQPLQEMGGVALRTALRLANGEKLDSHHVELATELIVRGSTAPVPVS
jgi:LacI family transcriptional regulator